jgi:hypothetical protein
VKSAAPAKAVPDARTPLKAVNSKPDRNRFMRTTLIEVKVENNQPSRLHRNSPLAGVVNPGDP